MKRQAFSRVAIATSLAAIGGRAPLSAKISCAYTTGPSALMFCTNPGSDLHGYQ
jgi:hypothetical protein